jgi:hypothetical protein
MPLTRRRRADDVDPDVTVLEGVTYTSCLDERRLVPRALYIEIDRANGRNAQGVDFRVSRSSSAHLSR